MKKTMIALSIAAMSLASSMAPGSMMTAKAQTTGATTTTTTTTDPMTAMGVSPAPSLLLTLGADGVIYKYRLDLFALAPAFRPNYGAAQTTIGMDFRPSDRKLYTITDAGNIYTVDVNTGAATFVSSTLAGVTPFGGGFQSFLDFNPVVDAIRLIGSNTQNYAFVNSAGGNLNATAVQTSLAYAAGDVNAGKFPSISAGAYTNKIAGAKSTILYTLDYNTDSLVTIAGPLSATGSSNTGGGQLQTIGPLMVASGAKVNVDPLADLVVYTNPSGKNFLFGINNTILFFIDLAQVNANLALGQTQNITVRGINLRVTSGQTKMIDLAIQ
jgi:hypothetical protein